MRVGRRLGLLLLWFESLKAGTPAAFLSGRISESSQALKTGSIFNPLKQADTLKFDPTSLKEEVAWRSQHSTPFPKGEDTKGTNTPGRREEPVELSGEKPTANPAGEYCTRAPHAKRRLVLVRRGCFGVTGSALLATSRGLARAGAALKRFDKLTIRQKFVWFGRKAANGLRYATIGVVGAVAVPAAVAGVTVVVAVAVPALIAGYISLATIMLIRRIALETWKYSGKGIAATGRGLQKAGNRMQEQSVARLPRKVPPTTTKPTPGISTGPTRL